MNITEKAFVIKKAKQEELECKQSFAKRKEELRQKEINDVKLKVTEILNREITQPFSHELLINQNANYIYYKTTAILRISVERCAEYDRIEIIGISENSVMFRCVDNGHMWASFKDDVARYLSNYL